MDHSMRASRRRLFVLMIALLSLLASPVAHAAFLKLSGFIAATGDVSTVVVSPDSERVVFRADASIDDAVNLFGAPLAGGTRVPLSNLTLPSTSVFSPVITPDSTRVVYYADEDVVDLFELYSVPIGGPLAARVKLNPTLVAGGDIGEFVITPDGSHVIYMADQEVDNQFEIYRVPVAGPASAAVKLSLPLATGSDAFDAKVSPDGARVVYRVTSSGGGIIELYSVPIAGPPSAAVKIKEQLGGAVFSNFSFEISPDSQRVVYVDDQGTEGKFEIYSVPIAGPLSATVNLNGPIVGNGDVQTFLGSVQISPDSQRVVYLADQEVDNQIELYSVPIGGPAISRTKLNKPLVSGGNVSIFSGMIVAVTADGSRVIYAADQDVDTVMELYSVPISGPASEGVKLNQAFVAGGQLSRFQLTPDGSRVVYLADQETDTVNELYSVPASGPAAATIKLNKPLVSGGSLFTMQALPGSDLVAYIATQETTAANELFLVPVGGPASAGTKASGPLVAGGSVNTIHAVPDGGRVLYTADAETDGVFELYIADQGTPTVGFPIGATAASETDGVVNLPVTLSNASISLVSVQFRVTGGTASQGSDYLLAAGTLSILPGQTSASIPLTLIGDLSTEGDETIAVTLESPSNAALGVSTLIVTLRDGQVYLPLVTR